MSVSVCVLFSPVKPGSGIIPSGQKIIQLFLPVSILNYSIH